MLFGVNGGPLFEETCILNVNHAIIFNAGYVHENMQAENWTQSARLRSLKQSIFT
jgi:hypothetical protein